MKKLTTIATALIMALGIAACGDGEISRDEAVDQITEMFAPDVNEEQAGCIYDGLSAEFGEDFQGVLQADTDEDIEALGLDVAAAEESFTDVIFGCLS